MNDLFLDAKRYVSHPRETFRFSELTCFVSFDVLQVDGGDWRGQGYDGPLDAHTEEGREMHDYAHVSVFNLVRIRICSDRKYWQG